MSKIVRLVGKGGAIHRTRVQGELLRDALLMNN